MKKDDGGGLIKKTPGKVCANVLPLAFLLTILAMLRNIRWDYTYIKTGKED